MFHVKHFSKVKCKNVSCETLRKEGKHMITRNGVCYDLTITPYSFRVDNLTYMFSSKPHLDKFKNKYKENRDTINESLQRRFNYEIEVNLLADIVLYRKIETRGFLIVTNEGKELCQKSLKFGGGKVTFTNSNE